MSKLISSCGRGLVWTLLLSAGFASAQTNRTWTGAVSSDWFDPGNWSPAGVPATNDIVNLTNGTINLSAPVVIGGQFNWLAGTFTGDGLTIGTNGVMNLSGASLLYLECPLTNGGTVNWTNTGGLDVPNGEGFYSGLIQNLPGGLWNIQNNQTLFNDVGGPAYFYNAGTLLKSAGGGVTTISIPLFNSGSVTGLQGTLNLNGGGPLEGTFTAAAGAAIDFSGGNFSNSTPAAINGPGATQLTGGNLLLLADQIPNLPLTAGTVSLGPDFQGGTITNLTIAGATLAGTNTLTGTLNWSNGTIAGASLTIQSNGVLNINGTTTSYLQSPLTNAGTVIWTNTGNLGVLNGSGLYFGLIENLPGGRWDIQNDQSLFNEVGGPAYFYNAGTLLKSAGAGTTTISIPLFNSGSVTGLQGTLNFNGGGPLEGTFTTAAGAAITFSGGTFSNSAPVSLNGPGPIQLTGGSLWLLADQIPNLALTAGTVSLGPEFQDGAITNLTIAGATLAGTNTVTGTLNWDNGTIAGGPLTIQSNGVLNINGNTTLYLQSPLTNAGTVIWTNTGNLAVLNGAALYFGLIENLAGGVWDIQNNQDLFNNIGGPAYFYNAGALLKSAGAGTTTISIPLFNSGSVTGLQGTLNFNGGGPLEGAFTASAGAAIEFSAGNFSNSAPVSLNGPGPIQFTGGNLLLLADVITNLPLTAGTVSLGPGFQGGAITNLTIAGATLAGTNTVTGTLNWDNGTIAGGSLTVQSNGVLNINGNTTLYLQSPLTNAGTVTWTNTGSLDVLNGSGLYFGLIENLVGGLWDIQNNQSLFNNTLGPAYFHNAGTLQKSAGAGTTPVTIPVTNSGAILALQGNLALNDGFAPTDGELLFGLSSAASYGTMSVSGAAALSGTVGVLWLGGFVPASGDSFTVLSYGSYTGFFTNLSLPAGALWTTNYGPTSFTLSVASIDKLAFSVQPMGGESVNVTLPPVVVQIQDPSNNPVAIAGVPITLALNSGSGTLNGTLTQNTDASGAAAFANLSLSAVGTKTLSAASPKLTAALSAPFQIIALIGEQLSNSGMLLTFNGSNSLGPVTLYASTNLSVWLPIYTNPPTNGLFQFFDSSATNYRTRFYKATEP